MTDNSDADGRTPSEQQYRSTTGIYTAVVFLTFGVAAFDFARSQAWWLAAAVPLAFIGAMGLAVELSRPREPRDH